MSATAQLPETPRGEILPGSLYRFTEACRRLGWSSTAARTARRRGLPVRYFGNRAYISGDALIKFVLENGKTSK